MSTNIQLSIQGILVSLQLSHPKLEEWFRFDFSAFLTHSAAKPDVWIDVHVAPPPLATIPPVMESMHWPKHVCFDDGANRYVNYYGRALITYDYEKNYAEAFAPEVEFLYEKVFLLVLSRVGELLDRKGLHRVHSLGVSYESRAALFLMPERGGKTTLGLSLMRVPGIKFLSDNSPMIDLWGRVYPFPLRLGVRDNEILSTIPSEFVRHYPRKNEDDNNLIRADYFKECLEDQPRPIRWIFVGKWIHSSDPRIENAGIMTVFKALIRDCLFGVGMAQIVEFFLRSNKRDFFSKIGIAVRRITAILVLILRGQGKLFLLGTDKNKNRDCLLRFLKESR